MPTQAREPRGARWGWILFVWTLVSVLVATQFHFRFQTTDTPVPWHQLAGFQLAYWYGWGLWTPAIVALARRFASERGSRAGRVAELVGAGVGVSLVMLAWFALLMMWIVREQGGFRTLFVTYLGKGLHYDFMTYGAIAATGLALQYQTLFRERSLRASQLETELVRAQLDALRMQLRPHFLFNTLNATSSLVEEDPPRARRMIARLSALLRTTLEVGDQSEVTLQEELDMLDGYLAIESCRFEERLRVERDVDPTCLEARVPPLVLQPLVENALRHGVGADGVCRIELAARSSGGELELSVRDRGPGPDTDTDTGGEGIGLSNVERRLAQQYRGRARVFLETAPGGGTRAVVRLPLQGSVATPAEGGS